MARFLAGVGSALLLVAAGFFLWRGLAHQDVRAPLPPAPARSSSERIAPLEAPEASQATREEKRLQRYDRDRDGEVSREEYLASRRKAFARLDLNHDGALQFDEYAAKAEAKFAGADTDRSGSLGPEEFATTRVARPERPRCPPARTPPSRDEDG